MHPIARAFDIEAMTDLFVRELTEGMGGTLIKAGIIKCATGEGRVSPKEEQVLRAAGRAHKQTGNANDIIVQIICDHAGVIDLRPNTR